MKKLYTTKDFTKWLVGWWDDALHTPLHPPLAISYKYHQKNLAYFSHLAPLILFFFTKRRSQKGRTGGEDGTSSPPLNTLLTALHLFRDMSLIGKESTIVFSAIDKLVALFHNLKKLKEKAILR